MSEASLTDQRDNVSQGVAAPRRGYRDLFPINGFTALRRRVYRERLKRAVECARAFDDSHSVRAEILERRAGLPGRS